MMGHEVHSYAVGIDENGVVHEYVTGDLKLEMRAKIEAKIKAEQAANHFRKHIFQIILLVTLFCKLYFFSCYLLLILFIYATWACTLRICPYINYSFISGGCW